MTLEESLRLDMDAAAVTGVPLLQLVELKIRGRPLIYQQLLLPTSDDGCKVNEVLEVSKLGALQLMGSRPTSA
jgi:hypothetical protein